MAVWFVKSGAAGAATGADWANAKTTLAAALSGAAAGDTIWVSNNHAETQATAMTLAATTGTAAAPLMIYCVDDTKASPGTGDLRTTATVTTTGTSSITITGYAYCYGITFNQGTGGSSSSLNIGSTTVGWWKFEACALNQINTSTATMTIGGTTAGIAFKCELVNTTVRFGSTSQGITVRGAEFIWRDTASAINAAGSIPTTMFQGATQTPCLVRMQGVDLSAMGAGKTIVGAITPRQIFVLEDCKLGASVTVSATPTTPGGHSVDVIRCDSSGTPYRSERYRYEGTLTIETVNVLTGGASDGTTTIAWKMVTTANTSWVKPFESFQFSRLASAGSPITVTVEIMNSVGALNNDDVWLEVSYLGSAASPIRSTASSTKANNLASGSAIASSTGVWPTGTAQKLEVTFTPAQTGYLVAVVKVAKASATIYVNPRMAVA